MFTNSRSIPDLSEDEKREICTLCPDLKANKLKNSPWGPFFTDDDHDENFRHLRNVFEISEISVNESEMKPEESNKLDDFFEDAVPMNVDECVTIGVLNGELEDKVLKLKEALLNINKDCPPQECCPEVSVFNSISPSQMPLVCQTLDLPTLNEAAIAVVLNSLSLLEPALSLITAAAVINHAVHSRMQSWTSDASRALTTGIVAFTKKYPKAVIDELLLPCLKDESSVASQADLLQDVIRNGLPQDQIAYCLRGALEVSSPSDCTLTAIHCLIDKKVPLDSSLRHILTTRMYEWSTSFNPNMKFAKFLKSVISIYGSQMDEQELSTMNVVAKSNSTFLKKSIENLLKKFSTKQAF